MVAIPGYTDVHSGNRCNRQQQTGICDCSQSEITASVTMPLIRPAATQGCKVIDLIHHERSTGSTCFVHACGMTVLVPCAQGDKKFGLVHENGPQHDPN